MFDYPSFILVFFGCLSLLCSIATVIIIYRMGRQNSLMLLIYILSVSQAFYDISIIMITGSSNEIFITYNAIRTLMGIATTLCTNMISFVILYAVYYLQVINVSKNLITVFSIIFLPSLIIALVEISSAVTNQIILNNWITSFYYWFRIASICLNILIYFIMRLKIYRQNKTSTVDSDPIKALAFRMAYYPIVQVICRIGAAWYEFSYGYAQSFGDTSMMPALQQASLVLYTLTLPSAGLGYFIVFILVTPGAMDELLKLLCIRVDEDSGIIVIDKDDSRTCSSISMSSTTLNIERSSGSPSQTNPLQMFGTKDFDSGRSSQRSSTSSFRYCDENSLTYAINRLDPISSKSLTASFALHN